MSNEWRLAGGLGIQPDPRDPDQVVMTQGIGFPLRPVDNVPLTDSPPLPDGLVAEGLFMQWMGVWSAGSFYPKGSYVQDGLFTCVAKVITLEKPAPVPNAAPTYALPTPWTNAVTADNISVVTTQQTFTFTESGWIKRLRIQVPTTGGDIQYRLGIVDITDPANPITTVIDNPNTLAGDWAIVAALNQIIPAGTIFQISLDAQNSSASTNISGGWIYSGPSQAGGPIDGAWNQDNQRTIFRINKIDLDSTDRSTELEGVIIGSTISVVQTNEVALNATYQVTGVLDDGLFMTYIVVLQNETGGGPKAGEVTTVDIDVPIPLATEYDNELAVWPAGNPTWATIESAKFYNDVDQGSPNTTAYGIDIEFEPASVSEDWDIITTTS
jgi:hypothetical protein